MNEDCEHLLLVQKLGIFFDRIPGNVCFEAAVSHRMGPTTATETKLMGFP